MARIAALLSLWVFTQIVMPSFRHLTSKELQPAPRHTGMDASIQSHGCESIKPNSSSRALGRLPSLALDSGIPRQSLTGAGYAGMTALLALLSR